VIKVIRGGGRRGRGGGGEEGRRGGGEEERRRGGGREEERSGWIDAEERTRLKIYYYDEKKMKQAIKQKETPAASSEGSRVLEEGNEEARRPSEHKGAGHTEREENSVVGRGGLHSGSFWKLHVELTSHFIPSVKTPLVEEE